MPLAKHPPRPPRRGCGSSGAGGAGRGWPRLGGLRGLHRRPGSSNHLAPRNAAVGGGRRVKAGSGRQPCSSQTSRGKRAGSRAEQPAGLGGVSKASPRPELRWEGGSQPRRQRRGKEEAQVHGSVPLPRPHASPGKGTPPRQPPWLSVAPGGYLYLFFIFFPALLRFALFFLFLRFWCRPW